MRVAIVANSGPATPRRIVLRGGQIARFGRTEWTDFAFPSDAAMADVHFAIRCGTEICSIQRLAMDRETFVNGAAVEIARLVDGDVVTAGQTQFVVEINDGATIVENDATIAVVPPEMITSESVEITELATYFGLSAKAISVAQSCEVKSSFESELVRENLLKDAIRWRAHTMPKPAAVLWVGGCASEQMQSEKSQVQLSAFSAALAWANEPTEENRVKSASLAEEAKFEGLGGVLAAAAGWSGGSLAPAGLTEVPPDDRLTGRCASIVFDLVDGAGTPMESAARLREFLKRSLS